MVWLATKEILYSANNAATYLIEVKWLQMQTYRKSSWSTKYVIDGTFFSGFNFLVINPIIIVNVFSINKTCCNVCFIVNCWCMDLKRGKAVWVYFGLYGIACWMPIQQKLTPPVLLFSDFVGWKAKVEEVFYTYSQT